MPFPTRASAAVVGLGVAVPPGDGGGLPVIGDKATTLIGAGLLVLALGAGLFRLARRRPVV